MKPKKRQKLCHNCEGEIDVDVIVCPFCAADLREEKPEQRYGSYVSNTQHMNQKQTMESLYPHVAAHREAAEEHLPSPEDKESSAEEGLEEKKETLFLPTLLFTIGIQLFVFGLLMLLFSYKGTVILKWDARFWFFYTLASIPFLFFGYKTLLKS